MWMLLLIGPVGGAQEHPYEKEKEEAWADAAGMVKTYSDEMVERWNKVIDTYLVFVCAPRFTILRWLI